jgi:molecular chaperone GrpE
MTDQPRAADPATTGSAPGGSAPADPATGQAGERVVNRDKRTTDHTGDGHRPADAAREPSGQDDTPDTVEVALAEDSEHTAEAAEARAAEATGGEAPVVDAPAEPVDPDGDPVLVEDRPLGAELEALRAELDERTRDLQRVTAEYANYRKRVDRDRALVTEQATGAVLTALLPILDDLDRAREHGDLKGPFGTVAEQLTATVGKLGLTPFGEKGDRFDPTRHEAVAHRTSAEVTEPTCVEVMRRGYLLGDRLLRAALVAVADPE